MSRLHCSQGHHEAHSGETSQQPGRESATGELGLSSSIPANNEVHLETCGCMKLVAASHALRISSHFIEASVSRICLSTMSSFSICCNLASTSIEFLGFSPNSFSFSASCASSLIRQPGFFWRLAPGLIILLFITVVERGARRQVWRARGLRQVILRCGISTDISRDISRAVSRTGRDSLLSEQLGPFLLRRAAFFSPVLGEQLGSCLAGCVDLLLQQLQPCFICIVAQLGSWRGGLLKAQRSEIGC